MANIAITKLGPTDHPWCFALRVVSLDHDQFERFIGDLKQHILPRDRKWDPPSRRWLLRSADVVLALCEEQGLTVDYDDSPPTGHRAMAMTRLEAAKLLYVQPDAPDFVIDAAFRAMAKKYHPDAGGDTETMQQLNAAAEVLR